MRVHGWPEPIRTEMAWTGTPEEIAEAVVAFVAGGRGRVQRLDRPAPLDLETIERLATEVRPMVDAAL